jgi:hypothetical protein
VEHKLASSYGSYRLQTVDGKPKSYRHFGVNATKAGRRPGAEVERTTTPQTPALLNLFDAPRDIL